MQNTLYLIKYFFLNINCTKHVSMWTTSISTMHPFKAYISLFTELSDEDWKKIEPCLTHRIIQENRIILKLGSICTNLYFLENGAIRIFTLKNKEEETTHQIQPPFLFTSANSFSQQVPSSEGIQALEESFLWTISRENAYKLLEITSWNNFISSL